MAWRPRLTSVDHRRTKSTIRDRMIQCQSDGKYTYWQRFVEDAEHPDFYAEKSK